MTIGNMDRIDVNISDNSIGVLIKDETVFNDVAFKVLQNQEKYGLIKCGKLFQNGKTKLVYDCGKYKALNVISSQLKPKEFLAVASNIHDTVNRILENGFIKMENLLIDDVSIYVDMADFSVHFICLPLTISMFENKELAKLTLEEVIRAKANQIQGISTSEVIKILNEGNYVASHETSAEVVEHENEIAGVESDESMCEVEKSSVNVAFVALIAFEVISILIGMIVAKVLPMLGFIILVVGCGVGICVHFVLTKEHIGPTSEQALVLLSTNLTHEIRFDIKMFPYTIGRQHGSVNGVIENEKTVGRVHCKIIQDAGIHYIEDMNSVNGTYVNNKKLEQGQKEAISKGDTIRISKIEFIVK